jgi:hypothetical protein
MMKPAYRADRTVAIIATSVSPRVNRTSAGIAVPIIKLNTKNRIGLPDQHLFLATFSF